jgi:hypothetical protein
MIVGKVVLILTMFELVFLKLTMFELRAYSLVWLLRFLSIELHAPTSSTQKLKLMRKGGQFTYTPTLLLTFRLPQAAYVEYWSGL